jgi:hypothetical protein
MEGINLNWLMNTISDASWAYMLDTTYSMPTRRLNTGSFVQIKPLPNLKACPHHSDIESCSHSGPKQCLCCNQPCDHDYCSCCMRNEDDQTMEKY